MRPDSKLFFDVHLMLQQPDRYIDPFIEAGADLISIHLEPEYDHSRALAKISAAGIQNGIVINPDTPAHSLLPYLEQVDLILFMTVNPGFGGQKFIPEVVNKISELDDIRKTNNFKFEIEVDGGIDFTNSKEVINAGANILVSGTTIFKENNGDLKKNIETLKKI